MNHRAIRTDDHAMHRFETDRGVVFVRVWDDGRLEVYEEEAAKSAVGKSDADFRASAEAAAARNKFGVGLMRRIFRAVYRAHPEIRTWAVDPVVRNNPTGPRAVEVPHGWR